MKWPCLKRKKRMQLFNCPFLHLEHFLKPTPLEQGNLDRSLLAFTLISSLLQYMPNYALVSHLGPFSFQYVCRKTLSKGFSDHGQQWGKDADFFFLTVTATPMMGWSFIAADIGNKGKVVKSARLQTRHGHGRMGSVRILSFFIT